ncbi:hypothetical protein RRG08_011401 [Elysia crispata]|uniref:G-protein coupled receptors family 1 profile domain-containing protein n=2 Tax=Elysia crispata TaxID=231223 RepID=A0AAE0ZLH9_9GAST|nr:hypothetical protein RRG08_011401 [Elysia crispata]
MKQNVHNGSGLEADLVISESTSLNPMGQLLVVISALSWTMLATGTIGIIGNILTVLVYVKLGFAETINISYVALAVSDLCCILSSMVAGFCYSPAMQALLTHFRLQVDLAKFTNFIGFWPQFAFSRTTAFLTAWISLERCLCVLFPTRVRLIITRKVTKIVITAIFFIGCCPAVLAYVEIETGWSFDPNTNTTVLLMFYSSGSDRNIFNGIATMLYSVVYSLLSWIMVTTCTIFLIIRLRQSAKWRSANASAVSGADRNFPNIQRKVNMRENRITKTVVMIACVFIACSLPKSVQSLVVLIWRHEYSAYGSLRSLVVLNAGFAMLLGEINSSTNIIFYIITGAKFRSALKQMFFHKS